MAQTVQAKEAKPDTIRFRHSMSSATVMVKVGRDSLPLRFKNHCIELDAKGDEKIINALQKHPRNGVLFKEVKPNEVADSVKSQDGQERHLDLLHAGRDRRPRPRPAQHQVRFNRWIHPA